MLRTRKGVEIARVGKHKLSTGEFDFTREHLAAALRNATGRPAARLGPGHVDARFLAAFDGEPAFGQVENWYLDEDGDVLKGDYVNVLPWVDDVLDGAYPGRSLDGYGRADPPDLRIDRVGLLGMQMPGMENLADLRSYLSDGPIHVAAGPDTEGRPLTVIVADTEQASNAAHQIFGAVRAAAQNTPPSPRPTPEEESMTLDPKQLRESLGLAEDASDADVTAKLTELTARPEQTQVDDLVTTAVTAERERVAASGGGQVPEGMKLIADDTLESLQASAKRADDLHEASRVAGRESFLEHNMRVERKFGPAHRQTISDRYDVDPDGTRAMVAVMASGVVPVDELGTADENLDGDPIAASGGRDDDGLLPESVSLLTPTERAHLRARRTR